MTTKAGVWFSMFTLDYAVAAQFQAGKLWIVPWLGIHDGWGHYTSDRYVPPDYDAPASHVSNSFSPEALVTGGLTLGVDIETKPSYRLTLYGDGQFSGEGTLVSGVYVNRYSYQAFTFGAAFRL